MARTDVYSLSFSRVFSLLCAKVEKKGRKREDVEKAIEWQSGYTREDVSRMEGDGTTWGEFLSSFPSPNPRRLEKKGKVCGISVQDIEQGMEREMRILDLLVDQIAKGKSIEKVLETEDEGKKSS
ncbi:MAG: DUF2200 family protein [Candidatus Ornithospirochaeta sp.]